MMLGNFVSSGSRIEGKRKKRKRKMETEKREMEKGKPKCIRKRTRKKGNPN